MKEVKDLEVGDLIYCNDRCEEVMVSLPNDKNATIFKCIMAPTDSKIAIGLWHTLPKASIVYLLCRDGKVV